MPDKEIKKKVFVSTPFCHCSLRKIEAVKLQNYFLLNNYIIVNSYTDADYHLCVTCAVTNANIQNHINFIKENQNLPAELIIMGCLPGTNPEELDAVFTGKKVITKNINDIDKYFPDFKIKFHQVPEVYSYDTGEFYMFTDNINSLTYRDLLFKYGFSKTFFRQLKRKQQYQPFIKANKNYNTSVPCFLRISSGCANNCAYCNIREAIGKIKSKSIDCLIEEYSNLLKQGYRHFNFIAEDLCSYGLDNDNSLNELLVALSVVDKDYKVKWALNGINPNWLALNYKHFGLLFESKIWEIMIAIESGSDRIIELMNRHYKIKEVEEALLAIRKINPGLRINSLFIVGFPSETDEDFMETIRILKSIKFDSVTLSEYSEFEKRASAKIFPKVNLTTIRERQLLAKTTLQKLKTSLY